MIGKEKRLKKYIEKLKKIDSIPYLEIPLKQSSIKITEGWFYSEKETKIHGLKIHAGIDFKARRNEPVYASAEGWVSSSYHSFQVINKDKSLKKYKNKNVNNGMGFFVQIYHPKNKRYTQYGHLSKISNNIPFGSPRKIKENYYPYAYKTSPKRMKNSKYYTWVNKGNLIGYVGDSGLTWGYKDYPKRPDTKKYPSWDEIHLHFQEFNRNKQGNKIEPRDPFNIYNTYQGYPQTKKEFKNTLWKQEV